MSVITYSKIMSKHTHALLRCVKRPLAVYSSRMISLSDLKLAPVFGFKLHFARMNTAVRFTPSYAHF